MIAQKVLVLGVASPAGMLAATGLGLTGAALTLIDDDLAAADRLVEALREQGCSAVVDAVAPTDRNAVEAVVRRHDIIIDTLSSTPSDGALRAGAVETRGAYVRVRPLDTTAMCSSTQGFRAFVDLTFTPDRGDEPATLLPLLEGLVRAVTDARFVGHVSVHASP